MFHFEWIHDFIITYHVQDENKDDDDDDDDDNLKVFACQDALRILKVYDKSSEIQISIHFLVFTIKVTLYSEWSRK